jgi:hypothetical protein
MLSKTAPSTLAVFRILANRPSTVSKIPANKNSHPPSAKRPAATATPLPIPISVANVVMAFAGNPERNTSQLKG